MTSTTTTTTTDVVSTAFPELSRACVIPADTDRGSLGGSDLNLAARRALWAAGRRRRTEPHQIVKN